MVTSIQISNKLHKALSKKKIFEKETYEEVIWNLIEDSSELSEEVIKNIKEAEKDIKYNRLYTNKEIKKELKL